MTPTGRAGPGNGPAEDRPDIATELASLRTRLDAAATYLHLDQLRDSWPAWRREAGAPDLWDDPDHARLVTTAYGRVKSDVDQLDELVARLNDATELLELALQEGDDSLDAMAGELTEAADHVGQALDDLELRSLFTGEHDERDAIGEIHSGAGGTDAQDWAEMLLRMYLRWAERGGFACRARRGLGRPGGRHPVRHLHSCKGRHAYGLLTRERGVHRLVRMSPFDAQPAARPASPPSR